jgi:hypothetical protein
MFYALPGTLEYCVNGRPSLDSIVQWGNIGATPMVTVDMITPVIPLYASNKLRQPYGKTFTDSITPPASKSR